MPERRYIAGAVVLVAAAFLIARGFAAETQAARRSATAKPSNAAQIERGRYLVKIAGCNDCHTPGYAQSGGNIPEKEWLIGDHLGWRGPWGTTYPTNLRLFMQTKGLSEDMWVNIARNTQAKPPMPWFALRDMTDRDLRAIYQFVKSLGPAGEQAPTFVPPDKEPAPPYVQFPAPPK